MIKTLTLELGTDSQAQAQAVQEHIRTALDGIRSVLERVFDKISPPGSLHRIEKLELDLKKLNTKNIAELENILEESLTSILLSQVHGGVMDVQDLSETETKDYQRSYDYNFQNGGPDTDIIQRDSDLNFPHKEEIRTSENPAEDVAVIQRSEKENLIFFLKHGVLPWQAQGRDKPNPEMILNQMLQQNPEVIMEFVKTVLSVPLWIKRLVQQFKDSQLMSLADAIFLEGAETLSLETYAELRRNFPAFIPDAKFSTSQLRYFIWKTLLFVFLESRDLVTRKLRFAELGFSEVMNELLKNDSGEKGSANLELQSSFEDSAALEKLKVIFSEMDFLDLRKGNEEFEKQRDAKNNVLEEELRIPGAEEEHFSAAEEIYINNAGLILFWPFLHRFLENLQLTQENEFISDDSAEQAAWMLGYLTQREDEIPESEMPLNKILCGLRPDSPLPLSFEVDEKDIKECEDLIQVLRNGQPRIHKFSNKDVLTNFINRAGSLSIRDKRWLLRVEEDGRDVLLAGLPWSVNVIKTPWMKYPLFVEWLDG